MARSRRRQGLEDVCLCADYTPDEVEFLRAIDQYKRRRGKPFPTWKEVLDLLRSLAWEKRPSRPTPPLAEPETHREDAPGPIRKPRGDP